MSKSAYKKIEKSGIFVCFIAILAWSYSFAGSGNLATYLADSLSFESVLFFCLGIGVILVSVDYLFVEDENEKEKLRATQKRAAEERQVEEAARIAEDESKDRRRRQREHEELQAELQKKQLEIDLAKKRREFNEITHPAPPIPQPSREEQRQKKMVEIEATRKRYYEECEERKKNAKTPEEVHRWENFYAEAELELDLELKKWRR